MAICHYPQYKEDIAKYAGNREKATRYMYQTYMKGYLRLVTALDENIGRLLDYLDDSGLSENTVVVYTSDNGFFNGQHGFFNKMWMYEPSLHLPLLIRYPGVVRPGAQNHELTSMLDLAPTFLDIAGAPVPADMQGVSMLPLLRGEPTPWRDAVYYHYYPQYDIPEQYGVRTKTHKLVHYPGQEAGIDWELFDLKTDLNEMHNLAEDPAYAQELAEMKTLLSKKRTESGDTS
jgi:arylsulfatase A-like enzyme